jgi:hypothetical protein
LHDRFHVTRRREGGLVPRPMRPGEVEKTGDGDVNAEAPLFDANNRIRSGFRCGMG